MSDEAKRLRELAVIARQSELHDLRIGLTPDDAERIATHIERIAELTRERDEARANYAFMVEKAAQREPTLDGYRELGAKCAQLEQKLDEARAENARLRLNADRYEWLRDHTTWKDVRRDAGAGVWYSCRRWYYDAPNGGASTLDAAIGAARKP